MIDWPNHTEAWREWRDAMQGSRMHHGWILAGKSGLGKHAFAEAAARELVGAAPSVEHHPDILLLTYGPKDEKEERKRADGKEFELARSIRISQIREMQHRLTTRPTLGDRRVVILNPADDMERNASNALLKSLEEPPKGTFFLLVTHRPAQLLPTIRSRCRILRFPLLSDEQIALMIDQEAPLVDPARREAALAAAGGSLGSALTFLEQDLSEAASLMRRLLVDGDAGFEKRGQLAKAIGARPDKQRLRAIFELAQSLVAEELRNAHRQRQLALIEAHAALVKLSTQAPTFNFDAGLLAQEIGSLLARAAGASERANV